MPTPLEQIKLLVSQLNERGVDSRWLKQVFPSLSQNYENPDCWTEIAASLRQKGNYGASELVYKTALEILNESAKLWNNYGILLQKWDKLKEALSAFDRAIQLYPLYASAITSKGRVLEQLHKFAEARSYYLAALELDPTSALLTNNIGSCFFGEGETEKAEIWFEKSLQLNPEWNDTLFNLTALHLNKGSFESAQFLIDRLARLLPHDPEVKQLQTLLHNQIRINNLGSPSAKTLESRLSPMLLDWCRRLRGNPRSVFISYAWTDPATKQIAFRLAQDLKQHSFDVVLDKEIGLEVWETLTLLHFCQNVLVLNDIHYAESCLMGKVPVSKPTSEYPSFALPVATTKPEDFVEMFKTSAVLWEVAKQIRDREAQGLSGMAFNIAESIASDHLPGLRQFIEGWRIDEIQAVFLNLKNFRSISVAYLGGEHCLAGYPLFDFSKEEYYSFSFSFLRNWLERGQELDMDNMPIEYNNPDWNNYMWEDSSIVSTKLWKISENDVFVLRPSFTDSGDHAGQFIRWKDWDPM